MKKFSQLLSLCFCLYAAAAWGQALTSLRGTVTDPSGAAIPGARVAITNSGTGLTRTTISGSGGLYVFSDINPGTYDLKVEAQGFQKYEQKGVVLRVELPATVNPKMKVGSIQEVVSVTGEAPALNTTDASMGHTMDTKEIEDLPLQAENMPLLLSLQPGVVYNGEKILTDSYDTRAGSVNGERSDQNNITLDGVSINDEFSGYAFYGVLPTTQFSVDEFRVTTSNYDVTEGRSAGAQISMVTKGGTNNFHGSLYEFNRNTVGEANDYFLKSAQLANGQPNQPTHLVRNVFGAAVGGPIVKNRLFFFANYEGHRIAQQTDVVRTIPSATLRDGIIQYSCDNPAQCPGGTVKGTSGASYPIQPGYMALGPGALKTMDPLHVGPSQVALNFFQTYPLPNDITVGNVVNYAGYRFAANTPESDNWYIGRLDYKLTENGNHSLFFRGSVRNDRLVPALAGDAPFLPGTAPQQATVDVSKGFVAGYTSVFGPHWVNSLRYGLTHQSMAVQGDTNQPWIMMRGLDQPINYSNSFTSPVHNIADTATWQKGSHNFQFGTNMLFIRRNSFSDGNSFSDALTNSDWLSAGGFAGKTSPLNPAYGCTSGNSGPCYPAVDGNFNNAYDFPLATMMGIASEVDAQFNYRVTSINSGTAIPEGTPVTRHWATDTYNFFFQDTWHALPRLTLTYGLNYQLMTPITETAGQEVTPSVNMGAWFDQRARNMLNGIPENQNTIINFSPAGSVYGRSGLYSAQTRNFAPRFGVAWSPHAGSGWLQHLFGEDKTVIRAGFGMYYDNFGPALALRYDASGAFGLSSSISNPSATLSLQDAPRITGLNTIPTTTNSGAPLITNPPVTQSYPVTPPDFANGGFAITRGIDQSLKTPYSYAVDFSIQRQLPGRMTLDVGYVGHFAHRLLVLDDVAAPLDLKDPKTGIDYFSAATRLSQLQRAGVPESAINASVIGATAAYWQNMLAPQSSYSLCNGDTTASLLVAVYDLAGNCYGSLYNETTIPFLIDLGTPTYAKTGPFSFYNQQYSSLWDWRSISNSNYHSLQVGLHRQMSQGILFGFNYTYSKSLDIESMAERGVHYLTDSVINPWNPHQMYGPSDFDLRHQINGYWLAELPFGHGKAIGATANGWQNAIIGGWQLGGTARWTSGYPFSVFMDYVWPTNWDEMGWADVTGKPIKTGTTVINGIPNVFNNPTQAAQGFDYAFPGESGVRNNIRGDGFFEVDMNLAKSWKIPHTEQQALEFRWSVFNVTNSSRFDIYSMQDEVAGGDTFGNYSQTLTKPRVMEFALIYQF